ncbi:MAG: DUF1837 domain-containing protein [Lachnospiraceae bacterium]|nr:DUF1837 domain-containing protein [Lachnospiraceae bacterium]
MTEALSKTLNHGDFDSVFQEVNQPELVNWTTEGELRLFHLNIRNNKITTDDLKKFTYLCIGDYVFSRAKMEDFEKSGSRDAVISQALRVLRKNGGADANGSGAELGEVLDYVFLEEKLNAPKLMSRLELDTRGKQYNSTCDGIHLLPRSITGLPYHQMVFGASNIVGDLGYAIDGAFEKICCTENCEGLEINMVNQVSLDVVAADEDIEFVKSIVLPSPNKKDKKVPVNTSYGVFLGYSLGLGTDYPVADYETIVEEKMQADIKRYIPYILQKIHDLGLGMHSFYFYLIPFQDAEKDKKAIMEAVLEGDVELP